MLRKKRDFRMMAKAAAQAAWDKKALDIVVLDIRANSDVAEYMVVVGADSTPQLNAICEGVVESLKEKGLPPLRQEGHRRDRWVALDYGGLLVHMLLRETREFYRLEQLWEGPKHVAWEETPTKGSASHAKRKKN